MSVDVKKISHLDISKQNEAGALSNALRKRHWFDLPGAAAENFDSEAYEGDRGAMFTAEKGGGVAGFLALTTSQEDNTGVIKVLRAEMRDPEIVRSLLQQAMRELTDKGISTVTVKISEEMKSIEHVFEEFHFHREGEEDGRTILRANL